MLRPTPFSCSKRKLSVGLSAFTLALVAVPALAFGQAPPKTGTDMELDPDSKPPPPAEPPPLPPAQEGDWGVGGADEEGKFAPSGKTGSKKREEEEKAEEAKAEDYRALPPREVGVDMVIGFGEIRNVLSDTDPTDVTVASFVPYFFWRLNETWAIGARVPFATGSIDGPIENPVDSFALGNIEASVHARFKLKRRMTLPVSLAITVPTAQGDMFPEQDAAGARPQALLNQAVAGARGWEEQAPYTPNRLGASPSVGFAYDTRLLHFAASTKFELLIKTGGGTPESEATGTLHAPAYNWVTSASFFYDFLDGMISPGLRAWLAVSQQPVTKGTSDYSGAQFVIEPDVNSTIPVGKSLAVRAGLGFIVPLGGPLGGSNSATINGFRLRAGLAF
ncbi:hypothetical protein [Polyangium mundeleinium]|uniref:Transporter n=1 Tax=Polyangium mundeleinium TaxID=2995306 RepID=A0ABT5EWV3_9BACT|nr:hypothetical protein [Polyangium mundeleinium]MDC0745899.1 hypothetical protein [Polyangium mundeleinium]